MPSGDVFKRKQYGSGQGESHQGRDGQEVVEVEIAQQPPPSEYTALTMISNVIDEMHARGGRAIYRATVELKAKQKMQ